MAHIGVFATTRTLSPAKAETLVLSEEAALVVAALVVAAVVVTPVVQPGSEGLHFKFESLVKL